MSGTSLLAALVSVSWRLMGTDMALIPADPAKAPALIVSDLAAGPARAASDFEDVRTYMWLDDTRLPAGQRRVIA